METLIIELKRQIDLSEIITDLHISKQKDILNLLLTDDDVLLDYVCEQNEYFFEKKIEEKLRDKIAEEYESEVKKLKCVIDDKKIKLQFYIPYSELPKVLKLKNLWQLDFSKNYIYRSGYLCEIKSEIENLTEFFKTIDYEIVNLDFFTINRLKPVNKTYRLSY